MRKPLQTKLEKSNSNYEAPKDFRHNFGSLRRLSASAIQVGIGETIKEGEQILNIVPQIAN